MRVWFCLVLFYLLSDFPSNLSWGKRSIIPPECFWFLLSIWSLSPLWMKSVWVLPRFIAIRMRGKLLHLNLCHILLVTRWLSPLPSNLISEVVEGTRFWCMSMCYASSGFVFRSRSFIWDYWTRWRQPFLSFTPNVGDTWRHSFRCTNATWWSMICTFSSICSSTIGMRLEVLD